MYRFKNFQESANRSVSAGIDIAEKMGHITVGTEHILMGILSQEKNKRHTASADKALLEVTESGVLCVITEKQGSAPRGVGSMMFVGKDKVLGSIGGGEPEYLAIRHARENPTFGEKELVLNNKGANGLDMICGGTVKVAFIPLRG